MAHVMTFLSRINGKHENRSPYQGVVKYDWVPTGRIDFATHLEGNAEEAELLVKKCQSIGSSLGHFHHAEYNFALVYAQLGDKDRAVESLRRAIDNGWPCYPFIRDDPYLDPLRESSEFRTVLNDLRSLWESYKNEFLPFDVPTSS